MTWLGDGGSTDSTVLAERYRLEERIGVGSMGAVWRAVDERLGRTVAVKQLLLQPGAPGFDARGPASEEARQRILREGRLAARLQHPHTIGVFDVVLHDDVPWLVMEYLESHTLGAVLVAEGPLEPRRAARIGEQVADGLAAAHAAGIVHRDIKPGNVLIGADGMVKITDFGVSRAADDVQLTRTGLITGTPAFLAPEVARGQTPTPASDVFALGSTIYAAVEGTPPFGLDENAFALLYAVGAGDVREPRRAGPLTATLMGMLRKDPSQRPTAAQARDWLAAVAGGAAPGPPSATGVPPGPASATAGPGAPAAAPPVEPAPGGDDARGTGVDRPSAPGPRTAVRDGARSSALARPVALGGVGRPVAIGVVVLVVLIAAAVALARGNPTAPDPTRPLVPPSAEPASPSAEPPPAAEPAPPPSAAEPPPTASDQARGTPGADERERFVRDYYALLPGDPERAWALLGDQARAASNGYDGFRAFYGTIERIGFSDGPSAEGDDRVRASVVFQRKDGSTSTDAYEFTVRRGDDGRLVMTSFSRP